MLEIMTTREDNVAATTSTMWASADPFVRFWSPTQKIHQNLKKTQTEKGSGCDDTDLQICESNSYSRNSNIYCDC